MATYVSMNISKLIYPVENTTSFAGMGPIGCHLDVKAILLRVRD